MSEQCVGIVLLTPSDDNREGFDFPSLCFYCFCQGVVFVCFFFGGGGRLVL